MKSKTLKIKLAASTLFKCDAPMYPLDGLAKCPHYHSRQINLCYWDQFWFHLHRTILLHRLPGSAAICFRLGYLYSKNSQLAHTTSHWFQVIYWVIRRYNHKALRVHLSSVFSNLLIGLVITWPTVAKSAWTISKVNNYDQTTYQFIGSTLTRTLL